MAEDQAPKWACDKANGKGSKRRECSGERIHIREEQTIEDQRCCGSIEKEVIPLNCGSNEAGDDDSSNRVLVLQFLNVSSCHWGPVPHNFLLSVKVAT